MDERDALVRLVRSYSPSGAESAGVATFLSLARELGYDVRVDGAGNGIARRGAGHPRTYFLGHVDTVPGELPVTVDTDTVAGRGACDAKAALVTALFAGRRAEPRGEYAVIAAVGEETDSRGARWLAQEPAPDYLIVGEPSGWAGIAIAYKGNLRVTFRSVGERTHLSSPEPTPADRALAWVERVRVAVRDGNPPTPFRSVTLKVVSFATDSEDGRERARVTVDIRLPPSVPASQLLDRLQPEPQRGELTVDWSVDAVELDRSNPVVRALVRAIRAWKGQPTLYRKGGTSDLNVVWPAWHCPAAVYGPGDSHLDHTDRERTSVRELQVAVEVLAIALQQLAAPVPIPAGPSRGLVRVQRAEASRSAHLNGPEGRVRLPPVEGSAIPK